MNYNIIDYDTPVVRNQMVHDKIISERVKYISTIEIENIKSIIETYMDIARPIIRDNYENYSMSFENYIDSYLYELNKEIKVNNKGLFETIFPLRITKFIESDHSAHEISELNTENLLWNSRIILASDDYIVQNELGQYKRPDNQCEIEFKITPGIYNFFVVTFYDFVKKYHTFVKKCPEKLAALYNCLKYFNNSAEYNCYSNLLYVAYFISINCLTEEIEENENNEAVVYEYGIYDSSPETFEKIMNYSEKWLKMNDPCYYCFNTHNEYYKDIIIIIFIFTIISITLHIIF